MTSQAAGRVGLLDLLGERDRLQEKVARAAHRMGVIAGFLLQHADELDGWGAGLERDACRTHAADLERFTRDELRDGSTEPVVLLPAELAVRVLELLPRYRCCAEVQGDCYCPAGVARKRLRLAVAGAPEGATAEPADDHARRVAR